MDMTTLSSSSSPISAAYRDSGVIADSIGGLEITIIATVAVALLCLSLVVVVVARCKSQEKRGGGDDAETGLTGTLNIVHLSTEKPAANAAWQDVPNCYVPDTCTLPRKSGGGGARDQATPTTATSSVGAPGNSSCASPTRPNTLKPRATPDDAAAAGRSSATDGDSVFCAVTPLQAFGTGGAIGGIGGGADSPAQMSQAMTPGGGGGGSRPSPSAKNTPKRLSSGTVSLDGPEYGVQQRGASLDRRSPRSATLPVAAATGTATAGTPQHRPMNPSPLSTDKSPSASHDTGPVGGGGVGGGVSSGTVNTSGVSVFPGSLTPGWPLSPAGRSAPSASVSSQHRSAAAATPHATAAVTDEQFRRVEDDLARLIHSTTPSSYGNPSPNPPPSVTMTRTSPQRSNVLPHPEHIYSYDALKAEVESLRKQAAHGGGGRQAASPTLPRQPRPVLHTADV